MAAASIGCSHLQQVHSPVNGLCKKNIEEGRRTDSDIQRRVLIFHLSPSPHLCFLYSRNLSSNWALTIFLWTSSLPPRFQSLLHPLGLRGPYWNILDLYLRYPMTMPDHNEKRSLAWDERRNDAQEEIIAFVPVKNKNITFPNVLSSKLNLGNLGYKMEVTSKNV